MLLAIVYGAVFVTVLGALASFVLTENRVQSNATSAARATAIAEAGVEYYRWFLAHYPSDLRNGTGQAGPYTIPYADPEGGSAGTIELAVTGNSSCGVVTSIDIRSTGTPTEDSRVSRTVTARYARPTVARYSYVLNDSVWAGEDRIINGPYHSNGGVRMDGTANAEVTSSLASWLCTSSFGCSSGWGGWPTVAGVFGDGPNQGLWEYPVPQVDFEGIAADFGSLKSIAQAQGRYLPRFSSGSKTSSSYWRGYHLVFNGNNTVTVRRVSAAATLYVTPINPADYDESGESESGYARDRSLISSESFYTTLTLPSDCALIFVEDNVWIEGTIDRKVTVVAANVVTTGVAPDAILPANITYAQTDGTDGLTVLAENNILIAPNSPENMTLNGIFVAQGGAFGRNYYWRSSGDKRCNTSYEDRGTLTILGTTVSNIRTGTRWTGVDCGTNDTAGYQTRIDAYDRNLSTDPPAFTPETSSDYQFVDWREE
jgi:hypothetical protein